VILNDTKFKDLKTSTIQDIVLLRLQEIDNAKWRFLRGDIGVEKLILFINNELEAIKGVNYINNLN